MFLTNNRNTYSEQLLDSQRRGKSMSYNKTNVHRNPNNRYQKHFDSQTQNESRDQQHKRFNFHSMKVPAIKYRLPWIKQQQTTLQTNSLQHKKIEFNRQYQYKPEQKNKNTYNYKNNNFQDIINNNNKKKDITQNNSQSSQLQSQYTQPQAKQPYRQTQQHKQYKYTKPWMIVQHNQDQQQNYEVYDHNNLQNTFKINQSIPYNNHNKFNDPQNLWKSKVNKKQQYIILNYLNGFVDKKRKKKSKKKSLSLNQINTTNHNQNHNFSQNISYSNLNGKSNRKIQPLRPYRQSIKTQMKKNINKDQIMKEHLQPTFIKTKNTKKNCPGNQNKHKRQLSTILLKQQLTLQKQQKLIEQLKNKVEQFQLSKNSYGLDQQIKKKMIKRSPKKQNKPNFPGRYHYQYAQLQEQTQNSSPQQPNLYKKQFQSIQKSLNTNPHHINNKINNKQQIQLIISHRTKQQTDNKTTLTTGSPPQVQQAGVNTYHNLKTLTSSNSVCNSEIKKSTITSRVNEFDQKKQNQKCSNISPVIGSLRSTSKSFKVQKRSKVRTNFPLRIPNLNFLKMETFYAVLAKKNQNQNGSNKILFQSSLTTSPINRSPSKRPLVKQKSFQSDYLNIQLPKDQQQLKQFIDQYTPLNPTLNFKQLFIKPSFQIILDPQKQLYFGQLTSHQSRHGYGIYLQKKYIYEGYWQNNMKIHGIEINESGYYKGDFKNNKKQGRGEFKWNNKQYYNGEWKNGKKHGNGIWSALNGDRYVGEWKEGKVEGQGIHTSANGQQYEGEFKNFLKSGWGKEHLSNGDSYQGDFIDGKPHGKGIYRWANGEIYDGEFNNGFRQFYGIFKDNYYNKYQGQFENQQATGLCEINFANGDHFEGNISNGLFNGNGKLTLIQEKEIWNGTWLNGEFVENL